MGSFLIEFFPAARCYKVQCAIIPWSYCSLSQHRHVQWGFLKSSFPIFTIQGLVSLGCCLPSPATMLTVGFYSLEFPRPRDPSSKAFLFGGCCSLSPAPTLTVGFSSCRVPCPSNTRSSLRLLFVVNSTDTFSGFFFSHAESPRPHKALFVGASVRRHSTDTTVGVSHAEFPRPCDEQALLFTRFYSLGCWSSSQHRHGQWGFLTPSFSPSSRVILLQYDSRFDTSWRKDFYVGEHCLLYIFIIMARMGLRDTHRDAPVRQLMPPRCIPLDSMNKGGARMCHGCSTCFASSSCSASFGEQRCDRHHVVTRSDRLRAPAAMCCGVY